MSSFSEVRNEVLLTRVYTTQPPQHARGIKSRRIPCGLGLIFSQGVVPARGDWRWNASVLLLLIRHRIAGWPRLLSSGLSLLGCLLIVNIFLPVI